MLICYTTYLYLKHNKTRKHSNNPSPSNAHIPLIGVNFLNRKLFCLLVSKCYPTIVSFPLIYFFNLHGTTQNKLKLLKVWTPLKYYISFNYLWVLFHILTVWAKACTFFYLNIIVLRNTISMYINGLPMSLCNW